MNQNTRQFGGSCSAPNSNLQIELESIKSNTSGFEGNLSKDPDEGLVSNLII